MVSAGKMATRTSFAALALLAIIAATLLQSTAAATYVVGDAIGWSIPSGGASTYTNWASQHNFTVGDTLIFNFVTGQHDLARVSKGNFDSCSSTSPISLQTVGPANFTLNSTGEYYFICTFGQHCSQGQKLSINATSSSTAPSPPPSSPSPAPSPTPTPTPSPPPPSPTPSPPPPSPTPTPTPSPPPPSPTPSPTPSGPPAPPPQSPSSPAPPPGGSTSPPPPPSSPAPGSSPSPPTSPPPSGTTPPPPPPSSAPPKAVVATFALLSVSMAVVGVLF